MQAAQQQMDAMPFAATLFDGGLPPDAMAQHLRRAGGPAALCFARAMQEDAAWAREDWGAYWADVIRAI